MPADGSCYCRKVINTATSIAIEGQRMQVRVGQDVVPVSVEDARAMGDACFPVGGVVVNAKQARHIAQLALAAYHAQVEAQRLRRAMALSRCQHEIAADFIQPSGHYTVPSALLDRNGCSYPANDGDGNRLPDWQPCWKGEWSDETGVGYVTLGEHRGDCKPCQVRERLRGEYADAKQKRGAARRMLTLALKKTVWV